MFMVIIGDGITGTVRPIIGDGTLGIIQAATGVGIHGMVLTGDGVGTLGTIQDIMEDGILDGMVMDGMVIMVTTTYILAVEPEEIPIIMGIDILATTVSLVLPTEIQHAIQH
jgi:hypothetical protein